MCKYICIFYLDINNYWEEWIKFSSVFKAQNRQLSKLSLSFLASSSSCSSLSLSARISSNLGWSFSIELLCHLRCSRQSDQSSMRSRRMLHFRSILMSHFWLFLSASNSYRLSSRSLSRIVKPLALNCWEHSVIGRACAWLLMPVNPFKPAPINKERVKKWSISLETSLILP